MGDKTARKIHRVDWARVQRDYATGRFTDQELAGKYSTAREVVNRRRRADLKSHQLRWIENEVARAGEAQAR